MVFDGQGSIYSALGGDTDAFYRYDIASDEWSIVAKPPFNAGSGTRMTFVSSGGGYIYMFKGNSSSTFWCYSVSGNEWTQKATYPSTQNLLYGFDLTWDGLDTIYAIVHRVNDFRKFSISQNTWTNLAYPTGVSCPENKIMYVGSGNIVNVVTNVCSDISYTQKYNVGTNSWTMSASLQCLKYMIMLLLQLLMGTIMFMRSWFGYAANDL